MARETSKTKHRNRSKPNVRGELSREVILDAAERHFGEFGYRGSSTAAIAAEAGISDPGLLHHFGSKDGLLMALLNRRYSRDGEKLRAGLRLDAGQLADMLEDIVVENQAQRGEVKLTMVLLAEAISTHHPAHEYFQMRYVLARTIMERHVRNLDRNGAEIAPRSSALASVLLAVLDGLQLQWLLDPQFDMHSAIKVFADLVVAAASAPVSEDRPDSPLPDSATSP